MESKVPSQPTSQSILFKPLKEMKHLIAKITFRSYLLDRYEQTCTNIILGN